MMTMSHDWAYIGANSVIVHDNFTGIVFLLSSVNKAGPGLLSNPPLLPLLVTATYEPLSGGGNTEINTENMSRALNISG